MAKPQNRAVLQHQSRDLMAIFWGLAAWCTISLACTVFLIFSGTATAQSHSQSNLIASLADLTPNQGVIDQRPKGRETGLPLPRYVSFRNVKTNMRVGPGIQFELRAVYNRQWMPMQVVAESGHWREVQDWEGPEDGFTKICYHRVARRVFQKIWSIYRDNRWQMHPLSLGCPAVLSPG